MKRRLICIAGMILIPAGVVCTREHWVHVPPPPVVITEEVTPAPVVEVVPACPGSGYVWIPGAWEAHRRHWVWIRGRWELPPHSCHVWERGHWEYRDARHLSRVWISAHWR